MLKAKIKIFFIIVVISLGNVIVTSKTIALDEDEQYQISPQRQQVRDLKNINTNIKDNEEIKRDETHILLTEKPDYGSSSSPRNLRFAIHNSLTNDHSIIRAIHKKSRSKKIFDQLHPITKYSSMFVDVIGGTLILCISAIELDYTNTQDSSSYKITADATQLCLGSSIVALKLIDTFVDYKIHQCKLAKKMFTTEKERCIKSIMESELAKEYEQIEIENAVNSYVNIDEDNINYWINTGKNEKIKRIYSEKIKNYLD